jgi:hypothetical protein
MAPPSPAAAGNPSDWSDRSNHTRRFRITARQDHWVQNGCGRIMYSRTMGRIRKGGGTTWCETRCETRWGTCPGTRDFGAAKRVASKSPRGGWQRHPDVRWSESRAILPYGRNHKATEWRGGSEPPLAFRDVALSDTAGGASGPSSLVALLQDYAVTGFAVGATAPPGGLARL